MAGMADRSLIEKMLIAEAPPAAADVLRSIDTGGRRAVARRLIARPGAVRGVRAQDLEHVIAEVERTAGLEAVCRVLQRDRRVRATELSSAYGAPVQLTEQDGTSRSPELLVEAILDVPNWHMRSALRDLLTRLGESERYAVLHLLLSETYGADTDTQNQATARQRMLRRSMVHVCVAVAVRLVFEGVIDLAHVESKAKRAIVGAGATGTLHLFAADVVVETLTLPSERRSSETIMQALWAGDCLHLTEPLAAGWRRGAYTGTAIANEMTALLAVRGALSDAEVLASLSAISSQHVSLVVAATEPCRRDTILRALSHDARLYDVSDTLESAAGMSTWALCDVVRRGGSATTIRWLCKTSSSAVLQGERGSAVAAMIVQHWEIERVTALIEAIGSHRYVVERSDLQYLALHAPAADFVLAAGGTLGAYARRHAYDLLGDDLCRWEYLLELLPKWGGSVARLVRAAEKLGRNRASCQTAPAVDDV